MSEVATQSGQQAEVEPSVVINANPDGEGDVVSTSTPPDSVEAEARAAANDVFNRKGVVVAITASDKPATHIFERA